MRRLRVALLVGTLVLAVAGGIYGIDCEENPEVWCGFHCDKGGFGWVCFVPDERCCWESPTGNACGDAARCDECDCLGYGNSGGF